MEASRNEGLLVESGGLRRPRRNCWRRGLAWLPGNCSIQGGWLRKGQGPVGFSWWRPVESEQNTRLSFLAKEATPHRPVLAVSEHSGPGALSERTRVSRSHWAVACPMPGTKRVPNL